MVRRDVALAIDDLHDQQAPARPRSRFGDPDNPTTPAEFVRLFRVDGPVWIAMTKELG